MYKNPASGYYEDDFRREGVPRWHVSYGTARKDDAVPLAATALKLVTSRDVETIDRIRSGELTIEQVTRLMAQGKPLVPEAGQRGAWPSVRDAVRLYLAWLSTNPKKSDGTLMAATTQCARFVGWLGTDADLSLDAIPTKRVSEYQAALLASGAAINTVTAYVWRVGSVFRWHRDSELRDAEEGKRTAKALHVPLDPDTVSTERTRRQRYLTEGEAERLLLACPDRLLCPVAIGLFAGLRIDEVCHLRTQYDVDLELGLITVQEQPGWRPKSKKRRDVPIAPPLRPLIERHLELYASEDWLTPAIQDPRLCFNRYTFDEHFKQIVGDAELVQGRKDPMGVVFHTLRHTFASWLVQRRVDLYTVAQLLGNSLRMVESTYAHLAPDFRQRAVDRLAGAVAVPQHAPVPATDQEVQKSAADSATDKSELCPV